MMKQTLQKAFGRAAYELAGFIVLPIVLGGTRRSRVAIFDEATGKILLSKTAISSQKWSLVGGGVKKSEDVAQGAVREILEETGIELEENQLMFHKEQTLSEKGAKFQAIYYSVKVKSPALNKQRFEILELAWFDPQHLPENVGKHTIEFVSELLQN